MWWCARHGDVRDTDGASVCAQLELAWLAWIKYAGVDVCTSLHISGRDTGPRHQRLRYAFVYRRWRVDGGCRKHAASATRDLVRFSSFTDYVAEAVRRGRRVGACRLIECRRG